MDNVAVYPCNPNVKKSVCSYGLQCTIIDQSHQFKLIHPTKRISCATLKNY